MENKESYIFKETKEIATANGSLAYLHGRFVQEKEPFEKGLLAANIFHIALPRYREAVPTKIQKEIDPSGIFSRLEEECRILCEKR